MGKLLGVFVLLCISFCSMGQITERERPKEWECLVRGARFMDRFKPMPHGIKGENLWGTKEVKHRYIDNGIESSEISFWGGNILKGADGKYHFYVCGWPESSPTGHMFWPQSTTFHAVSDNIVGPYRLVNSIGKGHNPEAFRLKDGRIVVYVIDGYYVADSENSLNWTWGQFHFDMRDRRVIEGLSNLTFARREDSSYLMVCRGGGIWVSQDGVTEYNQITPNGSIYPAVDGEYEDPVIWRDEFQYHLIVNDWLGRIAYYQRSIDGVNWVIEQGEAYIPGVSVHEDGEVESWFKYERPKVFQDEYGRAVQMNFAVIDTLKWEDLPNDRHSSKNISIPLNKGVRLAVLNSDTITPKMRKVEVKIFAEEGFNPIHDVDIKSLRFGSYSAVNFGRGAKAVSSRKEGEDLIVVFNGKFTEIDNEEFAPKMIGNYTNGELLYGYARLPYINYTPAILSAKRPVFTDGMVIVEVENFGLSELDKCDVLIKVNGDKLAMMQLSTLAPYDKVVLLSNNVQMPIGDNFEYEVHFIKDGKKIGVDKF